MEKENLGLDLLAAIWEDNVTQVKELLTSGADPNIVLRKKVVYTFCGYFDLRCVSQVFFHPPFHCMPQYPLKDELSFSSKEIISLLLEAGADLNPKASEQEPRCPVHIVVMAGFTEILTLMLKYGIDINLPDLNGCTPLHLVVRLNNIEMAKILINANADLDAKDEDGFMPIAFASGEMKEMLLVAGASYQELPPPMPNPFFYEL